MNNNSNRRKTLKDFEFRSKIGEGSYSTVYKAVDPSNRKIYAIKILSKQHIVKEKKIKYVNIEKQTLNKLGHHPGIVTLYYTFQDDNSLYFVIDFAEYGELLTLIRKLGSLNEVSTRYYMAQLIDAVKFMHSKGVIHRDLKPENILLNHDMKLMITDFGAAKIISTNDVNNDQQQQQDDEESNNNGTTITRNASFVGTAEYVSPELLQNNECGYESDIWAIGCIMYQFIVGAPPFKASTEYLTFEKIIALDYKFPSSVFIPEYIKHLVTKILVIDPSKRYTISDIEKHRFFQSVRWNDFTFIWKRNPPKIEPYDPKIYKNLDTNSPISSSNTLPSSTNALTNDKSKLHNYHPGLAPHKKPIKSASNNKNSKNLLSDILSSNYVPSSNNFTRGAAVAGGAGAGANTKTSSSHPHGINTKNLHNHGIVNYSNNGNSSNPGGNAAVLAAVSASNTNVQQSPRMLHVSTSTNSNLNSNMAMLSSPVTNGNINGTVNVSHNSDGSSDSADIVTNNNIDVLSSASPVLNNSSLNQSVLQKAPTIPINHDSNNGRTYSSGKSNSNNPFVKVMINNTNNNGVTRNPSTKKLQIMTNNYSSTTQQQQKQQQQNPSTPQRFAGQSNSAQSSPLHHFPPPQQQQQFMRQASGGSGASPQIQNSPLAENPKSSSLTISSNFNSSNFIKPSASVNSLNGNNSYYSNYNENSAINDHVIEPCDSPTATSNRLLMGADESSSLSHSYGSNRMNDNFNFNFASDEGSDTRNNGWRMNKQSNMNSSIEPNQYKNYNGNNNSNQPLYRNSSGDANNNSLADFNKNSNASDPNYNERDFSSHFNDILLSNRELDDHQKVNSSMTADSSEFSYPETSKIPNEVLRHLLPNEKIIKMNIVQFFESSMSTITDGNNKKFIDANDMNDGYNFLNDGQKLRELFLNLNKKLEYSSRPELLVLTSFGRILVIQSIDYNNLLDALRCDSIFCCEYITDNDDYSIIYSSELFKIFIIAKYDLVNGKLGIDFPIDDTNESWNSAIIKFNQSNMSSMQSAGSSDQHGSLLQNKLKKLDLKVTTSTNHLSKNNGGDNDNNEDEQEEEEEPDSFSNDFINSYSAPERAGDSLSSSSSMQKPSIKKSNNSNNISSPNTPRSTTRQFFSEKNSNKYKVRSPTSSSSLSSKNSTYYNHSSGTARRNGSKPSSGGGFAAAAAAAAVGEGNGFQHH